MKVPWRLQVAWHNMAVWRPRRLYATRCADNRWRYDGQHFTHVLATPDPVIARRAIDRLDQRVEHWRHCDHGPHRLVPIRWAAYDR